VAAVASLATGRSAGQFKYGASPNHKLTFHPDHSLGAGQNTRLARRGAGGTQKLPGARYKDHASGGNRWTSSNVMQGC
jgi:hypothetical protein